MDTKSLLFAHCFWAILRAYFDSLDIEIFYDEIYVFDWLISGLVKMYLRFITISLKTHCLPFCLITLLLITIIPNIIGCQKSFAVFLLNFQLFIKLVTIMRFKSNMRRFVR